MGKTKAGGYFVFLRILDEFRAGKILGKGIPKLLDFHGTAFRKGRSISCAIDIAGFLNTHLSL
jgi:hypothetical protein